MKKNMNENFEITVDEMTEIFGDTPVEMSFREVKEGMDSFFGLMGLTVELVNLIRKEDELKKHHRAYLHVREEIAECANEATEVIGGILDSIQEKDHLYRVTGMPSAFDADTECPVCKTNMSECTGAVPEPEEPVEGEETEVPEEPENASPNIALIIGIIALVGIGGGAYYYFKFVRGKKQKDEDLDFFDDEGYEEEPYINEDEEPVIADDEDNGDETKETEETI